MRRLYLAFVLVTVFAVLEFVGAYLSRSLSLNADAAHMLTDTGGIALAVAVAKIAQGRPTSNGRQQVESQGAILSMSMLALAALGIVGYAIWRLFHPADVEFRLMLAIAAVGLGLNIGILFLLHKAKADSLNVRAAWRHVASDTATSFGVIVAAVLIIVTGETLFDPIVSIAIGGVIFYGAFRLRRESQRKLQELREEAWP